MFTKKKLSMMLVIVLALAAAACAPVATPTPENGDTSVLPPEVVLAAQQWLANELGVQVEEIEILRTEQVEWPDACLGLGGPDEVCAQVITPGWRAIFLVNGQEYEVRTDETGAVFRLAQAVERR